MGGKTAYDCDDGDAAVNPGIDADGDGFNVCDDCDDEAYAFTPKGSYVFRKIIDRGGLIGIVTGDYNVVISADDASGDFTGTGTRELLPGTAYVDITGHVDNSGDMTFLMEQWLDDPTKTGDAQNYWTIDGIVNMCDGISEIHWVDGKEGVHEFILFEEE